MMPTTPNGTRTWRTCTPLAFVHPRTTSPTGSGSAASARSPSAMPATRAGLSRNRSISAGLVPAPSARATSTALASSTAVSALSRASAMACRPASLTDRVARARSTAAARDRCACSATVTKANVCAGDAAPFAGTHVHVGSRGDAQVATWVSPLQLTCTWVSAAGRGAVSEERPEPLDQNGRQCSLVLQQPAFGLQLVTRLPAGVAAEPVGRHHTVAGHDDRPRVGGHDRADRPGRDAGAAAPGQLAVGHRLAVPHREQCGQNGRGSRLQPRPLQRQVELATPAGEVLTQLEQCRLYRLVGVGAPP